MPTLDLSELSPTQRPTGQWAAALLHALARNEAAGRSPVRLTEPKLDTWARFRGRLDDNALVALLFEDAAVLHRIPFDASALGQDLSPDKLPSLLVSRWLRELSELPLELAGPAYIAEQARGLGVPTRLARSELHVVKPHQKVLELPGTGGQLAHHLVSTHPGLSLQTNFVLAASTWQELTLAGIVALDLGAPHTDFVVPVELVDLRDDKHPLRQRAFDFVVGLHPDKGGLLRVQDQLAIWYPGATILLV